MRRLINTGEDDNSREHYNKIWKPRFLNKGLDMSQPQRAERLLAKFKGGRFLEVGCGVAPHCVMASKIGESWGIDISDELITLLREAYPQVNYLVGNINDLPIKDNYFDCVAIGEVLEHVEDPEAVLKELFRVLKPEGWLSLSTPNNDNGNCAPIEHIWSYLQVDIQNLLGKFGKNPEATILDETNHTYIIGYAQKI
jgi:ubiquinone/menaquinone biosynthesis C-methylase UbiE